LPFGDCGVKRQRDSGFSFWVELVLQAVHVQSGGRPVMYNAARHGHRRLTDAMREELGGCVLAATQRGLSAEPSGSLSRAVGCLALIDLPAALELMKDLKDKYEYVRHHGNLAVKWSTSR
jgi:hypothetical protein